MEHIKTGDWEYEEEQAGGVYTSSDDESQLSSVEENLVETTTPVVEESRESKLTELLERLLRSSDYLEAAAVVSFDGLIMASALPAEVEEDRVAAMSAAILSLGEKAAHELGKGNLTQVFVEGEKGFVFLMSAREKAVLVGIARKEAKLGLVFYDLKNAAHEVGELL